MSEKTTIEWTDHTFNPWWGCSRVSPACVNCYADTLATRYGHTLWHRKGPRRMLSDQNWAKPLKWNRDAQRAGVPARVFCASMADVFEQHPAPEVDAELDQARARLWELISATPWLRWQLLTKRIENVADMVPWGSSWPDNVWLGTSVENQRFADERIPVLLDLPARVRFLSCEPLLGPLELSRYLGCWRRDGDGRPLGSAIDWVIVGGESGAKTRPTALAWVRQVRDQCRSTPGVAFLFKQWGGRTSKAGGRELDGRTWDEFPALVPGGAA